MGNNGKNDGKNIWEMLGKYGKMMEKYKHKMENMGR
jgi:hypothetical protein